MLFRSYAYAEEVEQLDELSDKKVQRVVDARNRQSDREDGGAGSPGKAFHRAWRTNKMAARRNARTGSNVRVDPDLATEEFDIFDIVLEFLQAEGYAETLEEAEWMMANVIDEEAIDIILGEAEIMKFQKEKGDIEARMDSNKRRRSKTSPYYTAPTKGAHGADYRRRHNIAPTKLRSGSLPEEYVDEAQVANRDPEKYEREQSKKSAPVRGERTPMPPRGDKRREDFEKWYAANVR